MVRRAPASRALIPPGPQSAFPAIVHGSASKAPGDKERHPERRNRLAQCAARIEERVPEHAHACGEYEAWRYLERSEDRLRRVATLVLIGVLATAAPWSRAAVRPTGQAPIDPSSLVDALLSRWVQADTPGAAVIVVRHGNVLFEKGYGLADVARREPITPRTVFDIASVSKPFTAMAILMLVEQGKLHFTDSLGAFFPEFSVEAREITVRQMLSHMSGLPDYTRTWGETRGWKDTPRTADNVVAFLQRQRLRFKPGDRWEYSNSNYVLLAQIVSRVAQESFPHYLRTHIFQPLGMNASFVYERGGPVLGTTAYTGRGNTVVRAARNRENYVYGDGQVNSTVEDLAKWARALSGSVLVRASTLREAFAPARTRDDTPVNYGFGWGLGRYRGANFVGHGGETDGFAAQLTHFPQLDFTVILLSNQEGLPAPFAIANGIAGIYLADELKPPAPVTAVPTTQLNAYVGTYGLYALALKIHYDDGTLWLLASGQKRVKLVPVSDDEFVLDGSNGASSLVFHRNVQGVVTSLSLLDQNGTTFWKGAVGR